jgi:DNA-binding LytR/AlgR family response regulator
MNKISCIVIDDEPVALKLLEDYVRSVSAMELKGKFYDALEAAEFLRGRQVDVIITDINMPLVTGLQLAESFPVTQKFVFTTAYEEYALKSFRYTVVDYLVKPITEERFHRMAVKLQALLNSPENTAESGNYLFVRSSGETHRIDLDTVCYLRGEKEYVGIQFKNRRLLVFKRMKEMEQLLPDNFKRIHISYIVNINHIDAVAAQHVTVNDEQLPIGLSYRAGFHKMLGWNPA